MYHGDGNTQEGENQQAISAAFLQTLCNSTESNWEHEPALPSTCGANVQVTCMQAGKLRSCVCLLTESLEGAWAALLQWTA